MHRQCPEALPVRHLVHLWGSRLCALSRSVEVWQPLLDVQSLAAPAHLNLESSLKFAQLCQKSRRRALAVQTLRSCGAPSIVQSRQGLFGSISKRPQLGPIVDLQSYSRTMVKIIEKSPTSKIDRTATQE